jgi:hypothetical protein
MLASSWLLDLLLIRHSPSLSLYVIPIDVTERFLLMTCPYFYLMQSDFHCVGTSCNIRKYLIVFVICKNCSEQNLVDVGLWNVGIYFQ